MTTLKRKTTVRKWHRNHALKLIESFSNVKEDRIKIKSLINSLTEKHIVIKQLDDDILDLLEDDTDITDEIAESSEFSDKLQIAFAELEDMLLEKKNLHSQIQHLL